MQRSQNSSFLCLMFMAQENIITAYITEDSDEFFTLMVFLSCFSLFFWNCNILIQLFCSVCDKLKGF